MKGFVRKDLLFSLCGLNCGLCTMHLGGHCPGCGGGAGNQSCATARCSQDHGGVEYCWQCEAYPCSHYRQEDEYDSFVTHQNRLADIERMRVIGPAAYQAEQREKTVLLRALLASYNDGRRKGLFALAANLLELEALRDILERLGAEASELPLKEPSARDAALLQQAAAERGILLKLRKKPGKSTK